MPPHPLLRAALARPALVAAALFILLGLLVYAPALHGGWLWDDKEHITPPEFRSWQGLWHTWFGLRLLGDRPESATAQYYPLTHTAFWVQWQLWGPHTLGYHVVNVLLHALNAAWLVAIVRRLGDAAGQPLTFGKPADRAAILAGLLFLLHPVMVESVAWITELKNTLSGFFYLAATHTYLAWQERHDAPALSAVPPGVPAPNRRLYAAALVLFLAGLLSKTVTATLPGAILVLTWWRQGRVAWADVKPTLPMWVLGVAFAAVTAVLERKDVGAEGAEFQFTIVERFLIAGRVVWFYLGKLAWPQPLMFIYPRWTITTADPVGWAALLAAAALMIGLVVANAKLVTPNAKLLRTPLAAMLYFGGTLLPVLGFFNVFPFIYSFVADHFQYLASLGIIVAVSTALALAPTRVFWPVAVLFCVLLGAASWTTAHRYADSDTLYRLTLNQNPSCWMAMNNLAASYIAQNRLDEAEPLLRRALVERPDFDRAMSNFCLLLDRRGRLPEAVRYMERAVHLKPDDPLHRYNLGRVLAGVQEFERAIVEVNHAIRLYPDLGQAHTLLGDILYNIGRSADALPPLLRALKLMPDDLAVHNNLGSVYAALKQYDRAVHHYRRAMELAPDQPDVRRNLQSTLEEMQRQ